jgi:hypothetical protein
MICSGKPFFAAKYSSGVKKIEQAFLSQITNEKTQSVMEYIPKLGGM